MEASRNRPPSISWILLAVWITWAPFVVLGRTRFRAVFQPLLITLLVSGIVACFFLKWLSNNMDRRDGPTPFTTTLVFTAILLLLDFSIWTRTAAQWLSYRRVHSAARTTVVAVGAVSFVWGTALLLRWLFLKATSPMQQTDCPDGLWLSYVVTAGCTAALPFLPLVAVTPASSPRWMRVTRTISLCGLLVVLTRVAMSLLTH